jgi:hypothetical protein
MATKSTRVRGGGAGVSDAGSSSASNPHPTNPTVPTKARKMTVKFNSLKSDIAKEQTGDWVECPDLPGVSFKVRSFNHPPYRVARDLLVQRMARRNGKKAAPPEEMESAFGKLYAEHILLDWAGFDTPYSPEAAREALSDPAYRDLRRYVESAAAQVGQSEVEFTEEAVGESVSA